MRFLRASLVLSLIPLLAGCPDEPATFEPWLLEDLESDQGFSLRTDEFEVAAGQEIQYCYFVDTPDISEGAETWVSKIVTAINPGSHHMNVFRVNTIVALDPADGEPVTMGSLSATLVKDGECFKSANWADWSLIANSQNSSEEDPTTTWELPSGVAHRFTPGEKLMLQVHYVNATTQTTPWKGKVGVNFYRSSESTPIELGTLFATQQSIRICQSNPEPTYTGSCLFPEGDDVHIVAANGHFHSRGERFTAYEWDGMSTDQPGDTDMFYENTSWDDPLMSFGLDVVPPTGGGVWWTCEYQWVEPAEGCDAVNAADAQMENDCCYTFGPKVETNEHCNVFVYYWPKLESGDIFCN